MKKRTEPAHASNEADRSAIDEVYRRRARALAARQAAATGPPTLAVLVFGLGTERYAIELSGLSEVFAFRGCTAVPDAPPALLGVINVRGEIRAVADLRRILELPPGDDGAPGYVLMLRAQGGTIGFKVDTIDRVRHLDPAQLVAASEGTTPLPGSRFVKALTADTVALIDATAALSHLGPDSRMTRIAGGRNG